MQPLFLFGAGFNADAPKLAGPIYSPYGERVAASYPAGAETAELCFGLRSLPEGKSFEDLFAAALESRNFEPLRRLAERLYHADYYVARNLASGEGPNSYQTFFETFADSHFLTFNYDSLPETFLFKMGKWYPRDGYGVPVEARLPPWQANPPHQNSSAYVVHLHGSLCIRASELQLEGMPDGGIAWLRTRERPRYDFDSYSIDANFQGYLRPVGETLVEESVIAPIPDKTHELKRPFIEESYERARTLVCATEILLAIGYSFNPYDQISYGRILKALAKTHGKLVLVSPESQKVATRLRG